MRAVSNSFLAALIVVALFWGNCFSCPQLLLTVATQSPAHGCCKHQKSSPSHCESQSLKNFVQSDGHAPAQMPVAAVAVARTAVPIPDFIPAPAIERPQASPPRLEVLHSAFRI